MENLIILQDHPFLCPSLLASPAQSSEDFLQSSDEPPNPNTNSTLNPTASAIHPTDIQSVVWDVRGDRWLLVTGECRLLGISYYNHMVLFSESLIGMDGIPLADRVATACLLQQHDALFLAFHGGELLLVHLPASSPSAPPGNGLQEWASGNGENGFWLEVVGEITGGILAAQWSPSEDELALVSAEGKLLCMTPDWEVSAEVDFLPKLQEHATHDQARSETLLALGDVFISWREDGRFFSTTHAPGVLPKPSMNEHAAGVPPSLDDSTPRLGYLRLWEASTCALHSQSVPVLVEPRVASQEWRPSLPLAWQPSGALIAVACQGTAVPSLEAKQGIREEYRHQWAGPSAKRKGAKGAGVGAGEGAGIEVVLFERNGLERSRFMLEVDHGAEVVLMTWSSDSKILGVVLRTRKTSHDNSIEHGWKSVVQLYHRMNYKWYLKLEWQLNENRQLPKSGCHGGLVWHPEHPLELLMWGPASSTKDKPMRNVQLAWSSASSFSCPLPLASSRGSIAAVVDGSRILLTDLSHSVPPPPLCSRYLSFPDPIRLLSVLTTREGDEESGAIAAVLSSGEVWVGVGPGTQGVREEEEEEEWAEEEEERGEGEGEGEGEVEERAASEERGSASYQNGHAPGASSNSTTKDFGVPRSSRTLMSRVHFPESMVCLGAILRYARDLVWLNPATLLFACDGADLDGEIYGASGEEEMSKGVDTGSSTLLVEVRLTAQAYVESGTPSFQDVSFREGTDNLGATPFTLHADSFRVSFVPQKVIRCAPIAKRDATSTGGSVALMMDDKTVRLYTQQGRRGGEANGRGASGTNSSFQGFQPIVLTPSPLPQLFALPSVCPWLSLDESWDPPSLPIPAGSQQSQGTGRPGIPPVATHQTPGVPPVLAVGLSEGGGLFVGQICVAQDCTSFLVVSSSRGGGEMGKGVVLPSGGGTAEIGHKTVLSSVTGTEQKGGFHSNEPSNSSSSQYQAWWREGAKEKAIKESPANTEPSSLPTTAVVYTTTSGFLVCLDLEADGAPRGGLPDLEAARKLQERKARPGAPRHPLDVRVLPLWEKGAKLVGSLGQREAGVVLVAPRGNLEVVYPRLLVFGALQEALTNQNYVDAFQLSRRHRLDLNILVDFWGWRNFVAQAAPEFVRQLADEDVRLLSELVCTLHERDSLEEGGYGSLCKVPKGVSKLDAQMDPGSEGKEDSRGGEREGKISSNSAADGTVGADKVTAVCAAIRSSLLDLRNAQAGAGLSADQPLSSAVELCVLTTLACSRPPMLEEALRMVKGKRDRELQGNGGGREGAEGWRNGDGRVRGVGEARLLDVGASGAPTLVGQLGKGKEEEEDFGALLPVGPIQHKEKNAAPSNTAGAPSIGPPSCTPPPSLSSEASLKHLMWLSSPDAVFDSALGLHDLPLAALAVVHHPRRDPREFFPLLEQLSLLPLGLMKFRIDERLGREEKAAGHMAGALRAYQGKEKERSTEGEATVGAGGQGEMEEAGKEAVEESGGSGATTAGAPEVDAWLFARLPREYRSALEDCMRLIQANPDRLFPVASTAFREDSTGKSTGEVNAGEGSLTEETRRQLLLLWGQHLEKQEHYTEAALVFSSAGHPKGALRAYRQGGHWRSALGVAVHQLGLGKTELLSLASSLREELCALGKKAEGGRVAAEFEGDFEVAVALLVEAQQWDEAGQVACRGGRGDLVKGMVVPGAVAGAQSLISEFQESQDKIAAYLTRYEAVHKRRLLASRKLLEADQEGWPDDETASTASTAASGVSQLSAYNASRGTGSVSGSSFASSTTKRSVTTAGGRRASGRAEKRAALRQSKANNAARIRAGSPGEELALAEHVKGLAPSTSLKREVGQLLEVLVVIGGEENLARQLQASLQSLIKAHSKAIMAIREAEAEEARDMNVSRGGASPQVVPQSSHAEEVKEEPVAWKWRLLET